ncbi:hypothetical protein DFH09DRAFT_1114457 [Mycena vulgaris]|nr:hypothetical protein DFH09DRAFT_1114457 [Mycena vulgaris]
MNGPALIQTGLFLRNCLVNTDFKRVTATPPGRDGKHVVQYPGKEKNNINPNLWPGPESNGEIPPRSLSKSNFERMCTHYTTRPFFIYSETALYVLVDFKKADHTWVPWANDAQVRAQLVRHTRKMKMLIQNPPHISDAIPTKTTSIRVHPATRTKLKGGNGDGGWMRRMMPDDAMMGYLIGHLQTTHSSCLLFTYLKWKQMLDLKY